MASSSKKPMAEILPGFWIGRMTSIRAIYERQLEQQEAREEWTVITIMSGKMIKVIQDTLKQEQEKFGHPVVHHHELWDLPDKIQADFVTNRLDEILTVISESIDDPSATLVAKGASQKHCRRNCLVHCARGVSRSAAVCAAWLISRQRYSLTESLDLLRSVREVNPNMGFLAGLRAIETCNGNILQAQQRLLAHTHKVKNENSGEESAGANKRFLDCDEVSC
jgi:protein-tyrosine phosphatase